MSLYREYRPQQLREVMGQPAVTTVLGAALKRGQVAHAILMSGSRGTGKTSTARIIARALNCTAPEDGEPCNTCENCVEALEGRFPDLIEIDGASYRKIEHAREILERVNYAPTKGQRKVYLIDEVHMLTKEAFNALLKTLEEPPEHVYFIFATTELQKVPDTIQSRCQIYSFQPLGMNVLEERLRQVAQSENIPIEEEAITLLAQKAQGGLRDALSLLQQVGTMSENGSITLERLAQEMGMASVHVVQEILDCARSGEMDRAMEEGEKALSQGVLVSTLVLQMLQESHRDLGEMMRMRQAEKELKLRMEEVKILGEAHTRLRTALEPSIPLHIALAEISLLSENTSPSEPRGKRPTTVEPAKEEKNEKPQESKEEAGGVWSGTTMSREKESAKEKEASTPVINQEPAQERGAPEEGRLPNKEQDLSTEEIPPQEEAPSAPEETSDMRQGASQEVSSETLKQHNYGDPIVRTVIRLSEISLGNDGKVLISVASETEKSMLSDPHRSQYLSEGLQSMGLSSYEVVVRPRQKSPESEPEPEKPREPEEAPKEIVEQPIQEVSEEAKRAAEIFGIDPESIKNA